MSEEMKARWSSRKWLTAMGALVGFVVLLVTGYIDQQTYGFLTVVVLGAYLGVNAYEHYRSHR